MNCICIGARFRHRRCVPSGPLAIRGSLIPAQRRPAHASQSVSTALSSLPWWSSREPSPRRQGGSQELCLIAILWFSAGRASCCFLAALRSRSDSSLCSQGRLSAAPPPCARLRPFQPGERAAACGPQPCARACPPCAPTRSFRSRPRIMIGRRRGARQKTARHPRVGAQC